MITISNLSLQECKVLSTCLTMVGGFIADGYKSVISFSQLDQYSFRLDHPRNKQTIYVIGMTNAVEVYKGESLIKRVNI